MLSLNRLLACSPSSTSRCCSAILSGNKALGTLAMSSSALVVAASDVDATSPYPAVLIPSPATPRTPPGVQSGSRPCLMVALASATSSCGTSNPDCCVRRMIDCGVGARSRVAASSNGGVTTRAGPGTVPPGPTVLRKPGSTTLIGELGSYFLPVASSN